ncbi:hypothetical protein KHQ82_06185 [Mycoplasmatota bacterium]|nr:hypothetical protein KHQ82_06185 [Mycoplasmatota bacterium]
MINLKIDKEIRNKVNDFSLATLSFSSQVKHNEELDRVIDEVEKEINELYRIEDVIKIPNILSARNGYKSFGKDPSRYRLAVESLFRRLAKGNKLYRINNVVDCGNLLSLKCQKSVAVLDHDKIQGDIYVRLGKKDDNYYGIGRGKINIDRIPLYEDQVGPFGSTTSDTERTMITDNSKNILVLIISFNGRDQLHHDIEIAKDIYRKYCNVKDFKIGIYDK